MKKLVIIPAYNEEKNIAKVISKIKEINPVLDILVVDDGSLDKTALMVQKTRKAEIIILPFNLGIGGAVQAGFKYAYDNNYDVIIRVDADGQHKAEEINRLVKPIIKGEADLVIGSRFLEKKPTVHTQQKYPSSIKRIGQKIISSLISFLIRQKITDSTSGFRVYNKESLILLNKYYPSDYPEPEEIMFLKKNKFKIKEVGVSIVNRQEGKSSLTVTKSIYYIVKIILVVLISVIRTPIIKIKK